ncbi:Flp pilus assembly protein TadG [Oxalobacteraceae bacterium GrIS 1.11]
MRRARAQDGAVAVELAFIMLFMLMLIACTLILGRAFWQYNVLQKAGQNALRYMASIPPAEIALDSAATTAGNTAKNMLTDAAARANIGPLLNPILACHPTAGGLCGANSGGALPTSVELSFGKNIDDNIFFMLTNDATQGAMLLWSDVTVPYGN